MAPKRRSPILPSLALSMLLSACAQKAAAPDPADPAFITPPAIIVEITDDSCPNLEALPGMTVGWINRGKKEHVVKSEVREDGSRRVDSGVLQPGGAFAMSFFEPGTIPYVCSADGSLQGTITVPDSPPQPVPFPT